MFNQHVHLMGRDVNEAKLRHKKKQNIAKSFLSDFLVSLNEIIYLSCVGKKTTEESMKVYIINVS